MNNINLSPLVPIFGPILLLALSIYGPLILHKFLMVLHVSLTSQQEAKLDAMVQAEANILYGDAANAAAKGILINVGNAHFASAANHIILQAPDIARRLGVSPAQLAEKVKAAYGSNLVSDPAASVRPNPTGPIPIASSPTPLATSASDQNAALPSNGGTLAASSGGASGKITNAVFGLFLAGFALSLSACSMSQPSLNTNGTPSNAAQQTVATMYGAYTAAVAAESLWLNSRPPTAKIKEVEAARQQTYAQLKGLETAANKGVVTSAQVAAVQGLLDALNQLEVTYGISPTSLPPTAGGK